MGLETATYLDDLNSANPVGATDKVREGDDHIRLVKAVLKATFPSVGTFARYLERPRVDVPDSATPALWAAASNYGNLLGTTAITGFASGTDGQLKLVRIDEARTLTHNATTLDLPGGGNIVAAAGDHMLVHCRGTTSNAVIAYWPDTGSHFPSGTAMLFAQTAAPLGWTKSTTHDDKALRVVSGTASSGGTTPFSTAFAMRYITTAHMPTHSHGVNDPGHVHSYYLRPSYVTCTGGGLGEIWTGAYQANTAQNTTGITIQNAGSSTGMPFDVTYVDVIIAIKD